MEQPTLKLIKGPVPEIGRSRTGLYKTILEKALALPPNSEHYRWPFESRKEQETALQGLYATRRRHKSDYGKVGIKFLRNDGKKDYRIFLWRKE